MTDLTQTQAWREAVEEGIRASDFAIPAAQVHRILTAALPHLRKLIEREAFEKAAKVADGPAEAWGQFPGGTPERDRVAAAIRALSPKEPT